MARHLLKNNKLKYLNLSDNELKDQAAIIQLIKQNNNLVKLDLSNISINDYGFDKIIKAVYNSQNIIELVLNECSFDESKYDELAAALFDNVQKNQQLLIEIANFSKVIDDYKNHSLPKPDLKICQ